MKGQCVIFDCDGVLVDSEVIATTVLLEAIAEVGGQVDEHFAYTRFLGVSTIAVVDILAREFKVDLTAEHLINMRSRLRDRLRHELKPIPGVAQAIGQLETPYCVASSSQPERIRLALAVTGLLDAFEPHIYSASMVRRGKPAPDLFLHAASSMGLDPAECIVIEDSPAGIQAAQAAGMRVLAFVGGSHARLSELHAAATALAPDSIIDDMRDLPGLLATMHSDV